MLDRVPDFSTSLRALLQVGEGFVGLKSCFHSPVRRNFHPDKPKNREGVIREFGFFFSRLPACLLFAPVTGSVETEDLRRGSFLLCDFKEFFDLFGVLP